MAHCLEERESEVYDEFFATKEDDEYINNIDVVIEDSS
jgi:hypothetical protein